MGKRADKQKTHIEIVDTLKYYCLSPLLFYLFLIFLFSKPIVILFIYIFSYFQTQTELKSYIEIRF